MTYSKREPNRRDRWKTKVAKTPTVPAAARLFLVTVLAPKMKADGTVSESRWKLARDANVSERRVTMFITQAKEAGWLVVVQPGYRSMTAVYQATFPNPESGNNVFPHSAEKSGNKTDPHCAGTECSPIPAEKREQSVPTTSSSTTRRLRVVDTVRRTTAMRTPCGLPSLRFGFGADIHQPHPTARTTCRTQPQADERHRWMTTAAQVETQASGTEATTRSGLKVHHAGRR